MAFDLGMAIKITAGVAGLSAVQNLAGAIRQTSGVTLELGTHARRAGEDFSRFSAQALSAGNVAAGALASVRNYALQIVSALSAIQFARIGVQFNSVLEQGRLGIASLIMAQSDLRDAAGRTLTGHEALTAAIAASDEQMTKLRIAGLQTAATTEQLVEAYQQAVGAGLAAGLTLDQVRETTIGIVQAAGALGVPMFQITEEVRSILGGTINMHSRVAKALGLSNEMVASWREQGVLVQRLNERLQTFGTAGEEVARTWAGVKSNLQEAVSVLAGGMTEGMFERLKESAQTALSGLLDTKSGTLAKEIDGLAAAGRAVFDRIGQALGAALQGSVALAKELSGWLAQNPALVADLVEQVSHVGKQIWGIVEGAASMVKFVAQWAVETGGVNVALRGVALLVAGLRDGVGLIGAIVVKLGALLVDYLVQPFNSLLGLIGRAINVLHDGWGDALIGLEAQWSGVSAGAHEYARQVFGDFAAGRTAVTQLRAEWDRFDAAVERTAKKSKTLPQITGRPSAPTKDQSQSAAERLLLSLTKERAKLDAELEAALAGPGAIAHVRRAEIDASLRTDKRLQGLTAGERARLQERADDIDATKLRIAGARERFESADKTGRLAAEVELMRRYGDAVKYTDAALIEYEITRGKFASLPQADQLKLLADARERDSLAQAKDLMVWNKEHRQTLDQLRFENSLTGERALAQKLATEMRKVDLAVQERSIGLSQEHREALLEEAAVYKGELRDAILESHEASRSLETGVKSALNAYLDEATNTAAQVQGILATGFQKLEDVIVGVFTRGKFEAEEFFEAVYEGMVRMYVQNQITAPLYEGLFGTGGALSGLFSGGAGGEAAALAAGTIPLAAGGIMTSAGKLPLNTYSTGGIAYRPQIALFGEGRRPEAFVPLPDGKRIPVALDLAGVAAAAPGGAQNVRVEIVNEGTPQQVVSAQPGFDVEGMVVRIVTRDIQTNGDIATSMQNQWGLNRAAGAVR